MAWVDNGKGQWVQVTGEGEINTPVPPTPPPSASGGKGGIQYTGNATSRPVAPAVVDKPPAPDGWTGWKWDGYQWSDAHDPGGHQGWAQQQQLAAAGNAAGGPPTMADANAQGFDPASIGLDSNALDPYRAERTAALGDQRRVLEQSLNLEGPKQLTPEERVALEQRFAERATLAANSAASNARGGAGAVAAARLGVNQQMPQIAGEANLQAQQVADQEYQGRVAAFGERVKQLSTAGGIANTIGQTATGAFGQEAGFQESGAQVALSSQQLVGNMVQHLNELGLDYSKLDIAVQESILDDLTQRYGIDKAAAAQIKAASIANKKGPLDYLVGIAGGVSGVASGIGLLKGGGAKTP